MKILVIDGNSLINRAFYGIRILSTAGGEYTNAVYGFLSAYFKLIDEENPDGACVCFDLKAPTFRHLEFSDYKAGRRPMPEELVGQLPILKEVLDTMGIARCELAGFEADDLIGTIGRLCQQSGDEAVIVTGDRDSLQLTDDRTRVKIVSSKEGKTITTEYTPEVILEKFGITPKKLIEVKALMGDASDNIPGVAGIGEKTALDLIQKFSSVDYIYENIETIDIREAVRKKLLSGRESAYMSLRLAEIDCNVPIEFCDVCTKFKPYDEGALYNLFMRLELKTFIRRLSLKPPAPKAPKANIANGHEQVKNITSGEQLLELCDNILDKTVSFVRAEDEQCIGIFLNDTVYTIVRSDVSQSAWDMLITNLASDRVKKQGHDIKAFLVSLFERGISFGGFIFDTAIGGYLLDPSTAAYEVRALSLRYLGEQLPSDEFNAGGALSLLGDRDSALAALCAHTTAVARLAQAMKNKLIEQDMYQLYYNVELPLCEVLASMQYVGVRVDTDALIAFSGQLTTEINALETKIYELAGMEFNINSPKQLGEVLFEKLELPFKKKTKSGYSTDIDTLKTLKHLNPIVDEIIEYRSLTKLRSTYADGLMRVVSPRDGRIHSSFNQLVTTTGRISSTEPNLQNIPVRQERGAELRRMFVADKGQMLVDADYSQIELRVLAHIADDDALKEAFRTGGDIHRMTAASVEGVSEVTPAMRSKAKAVNFGLVYGMSEYSLAANIGVSRAEAKQYIENYFLKYPGVKTYMEKIKETARDDGFVKTLMGRRRYLPELASTNHNIRAFGERLALNTPIQGTAADIIKIAMVNVYQRLRREGMKARLILQVHDELIAEAPAEELSRTIQIVEEEMSGAMKLCVPLVAEAASADNWFDAKK